MTGRSAAEVQSDPRHGSLIGMVGDGEVVVVSLTDALRDALATCDTRFLHDVATGWSRTEGVFYYPADPEDLTSFLKQLSGLAGRAVTQGARLYCWICPCPRDRVAGTGRRGCGGLSEPPLGETRRSCPPEHRTGPARCAPLPPADHPARASCTGWMSIEWRPPDGCAPTAPDAHPTTRWCGYRCTPAVSPRQLEVAGQRARCAATRRAATVVVSVTGPCSLGRQPVPPAADQHVPGRMTGSWTRQRRDVQQLRI